MKKLFSKKLVLLFIGLIFLALAVIGICGCDDDSSSSPPPPPPPPPVYNVTTTVVPAGMSPAAYIDMFFNDPANPVLQLVVPDYVYFQGLVYSKGNIKTMGPIRVMGGMFCTKDGSGDVKQVTLEGGAMVTTVPEYQRQKLLPPRNRFRVVNWSEVGTESTRGKATP